MSKTVIGWTDAYTTQYKIASFTEERKKALVERMRKRKYNFNHFDHEMLSYTAPFYDDEMICVLTKSQFDDVMNEAYKDIPRGQRLLPQDVIEDIPHNGVLYEKKKFYQEGDVDNG
jgi:hypothetical protein